MKKAIIFGGIAILVVLGFLYYYAISSPHKISSAQANELIQSGKADVILDVRTDTERNMLGYYPGSVHIQSADLVQAMPTKYPNKDITIIAYCNTGQRSRRAADILHSLGYRNAYYITGPYTTLE
jgi:phage shock protein E